MKDRIGIAWSGGIDSTYRLAKLLIETDADIEACHFVLKNNEKRDAAETESIKKLMPKLLSIRNFVYKQRTIDNSELDNAATYDMAEVCFGMGAIAKSRHFAGFPWSEWTIGTHKDEGHDQERWDVIIKGAEAAAWSRQGKMRMPPFRLYPMDSKAQEMIYLYNIGVLEDCWYCREPKLDFQVCGACKTCAEVRYAILDNF